MFVIGVCVFQIILPTGTVVRVQNGKGGTPEFINVWITASAADFDNTAGEQHDWQ